MNDFRKIARQDRDRFNRLRKAMDKQSAAYPETLQVIYHPAPFEVIDRGKPVKAWRNRRFLVQLYIENGHYRLTVSRSQLQHDGNWKEDITWDELMELKRQAGYGDRWAVEIYPPDHHTVNLANMRHLWITDQPSFAWTKQ